MGKKYTFLNLAEDVLKETQKPMSANEIWKYAESKSMQENVESNGVTPWKTLRTRIYRDITENKEQTKFIQLSKNPAKYGLKDLSYSNDTFIADEFEKKGKRIEEEKLHKLLTTFVKYDSHFKCHTKTIVESKSRNKKKGLNEWVHPDIVGVYFPFVHEEDYENGTLQLMDCLKQNKYKIYSFELKVDLTNSNVKPYYFQAVSNSSWANEGYLVVLNLDETDEDLLNELRRLNNAFGIGIIKLDAKNIAESKIIFTAKYNERLDFDTINKLINIKNSDFIEFIENIKKSNEINVVYGNFDEPLNDSEYEKYIKENHLI